MPDIITFAEARQRGLGDYFTGKPCKRGHVSLRTVSSGMCKQCASDSNRAWMVEKAEDRKEWRREYTSDNIERVRHWRRSWEQRNPEKAKESNRKAIAKQLAKDPDVYRRRAAQWAKDNPERARANVAKRRAIEIKADGVFTDEDIRALFTKQDGACSYCFVKFRGIPYHIDHMTPLVRGGSNWPSNLQLCCPTCNLTKGKKTHVEFLAYRTRPEKVAA